MKKIVCVVLAVLFVFAFVGCSNGRYGFSEKNYLSENGQIRSIIIDVADRELNIGLSSDGQISVNYFDSEKQYLEISVSESNELVIRLAYDRSWTDFIGVKPDRKYRGITVLGPRKPACLAQCKHDQRGHKGILSRRFGGNKSLFQRRRRNFRAHRRGREDKPQSQKRRHSRHRRGRLGRIFRFLQNQKGRLQSAVEARGRRPRSFLPIATTATYTSNL